MKQSILQLEPCACSEHSNLYRTIFKTRHGRILYFELETINKRYIITNCYYIDRNQQKTGSQRYSTKPLKLQTFQFESDNLLQIIESELDKKFYEIQFIHTDLADLPPDQFIQAKLKNGLRKYQFLIMVGDGETYNGLPIHLRTRIKNKLHRSIYIELSYYKEGKGVVKQCNYYDRKYKRQDVIITPQTLVSCFFPYDREGILNLFNHELCCEFNHILITGEIDLDSNTTPLCGAV